MDTNKHTVIAFAVAAALGATVCSGATRAGTQAPANSATASSSQSSHAGVTSATHEDTRSMERLKEAAQRLRESIQTLATAPAGEKRNEAIDASRQALLETQQAMIDLPPGLRVRSGPMTEAEYAAAMDKLKEAAQRLRDSAHAMATQPAGQRRNEAIDQVNAALLQVNEAMVQLPWQPGAGTTTTGATSGKSISGNTASRAAGNAVHASRSFDAMDRNHDGVLSRSEFSTQ